MSNWQKLNYSGDKFKPFHIKLDYCDEDMTLRDIYKYDDDQEWIDKTAQEIADGYKYFVILRARGISSRSRSGITQPGWPIV